MHWESHDFALPKLPRGQTWRKVFCTEEGAETGQMALDRQETERTAAREGQVLRTGPRSITLYYSGNGQSD